MTDATDPGPLVDVAGAWAGTHELWLDGDRRPVEVSEGTATVDGWTLVYRWSRHNGAKEGRITLRPGEGGLEADFQDTFHQDTPRPVTVTKAPGGLHLAYTYEPGPPPWSWRIEIDLAPFALRMFNLVPALEGRPAADELAVRFVPTRVERP